MPAGAAGRVDQRACWPCALRLHESNRRDAAQEGTPGAMDVAPIDVVLRNALLICGTSDGESPCNNPAAQINVALPCGSLRSHLRCSEVNHRYAGRNAANLRWHLTRRITRHCHQACSELWHGHTGNLHLQQPRARCFHFPDGIKLEARLGHPIHLVVVDVRLVIGRGDVHNAADDTDLGLDVLEGHRPGSMERRVRGFHC
mmetsp:Transcript_8228/g.22895  ORF Transcript_8228/g.22895 Transcript_8228/m.22895 type:complete len:201 (-) Transcript_8228:1126-1728(-)